MSDNIKTKSNNIDNVTKIAPGFYLVRTQAGFEKAIKDEFSNTFSDLKYMMMKQQLDGYPTSYPSIVSLSIGYTGIEYIVCKCVHVNIMKEAIKDA